MRLATIDALHLRWGPSRRERRSLTWLRSALDRDAQMRPKPKISLPRLMFMELPLVEPVEPTKEAPQIPYVVGHAACVG
jgi:hypothetical protein